MEPNTIHRPAIKDVLEALVTVLVLLPCTAIHRFINWLLSSRLDRKPLKEILGKPLFVSLAPNVPVSILQYLGSGLSKGSDVLNSKRYANQRSHLLRRVQKSNFAGYWVCRGLGENPAALQDIDILLFYIHGGAYILGWPALDAPQILLLAEAAAQEALNMACFALEYSHAPGACLPAQTMQARAAYEWLVKEQGIPTCKISIMGESAGGHLVLALLTDLHLRPSTSTSITNLPQEIQTIDKPASAFLISPWIDLFNSNPRLKNISDFENAFGNWLRMCAGMVLRTTPDQYRALVENFATTVKGRGSWRDILPNTTWVSGGSKEQIFVEDMRDFVALAQKDGAQVMLEVHEGGEHAWQNAEARLVRMAFLASDPSVDDQKLMPGYRALAKQIVRGYQKKMEVG